MNRLVTPRKERFHESQRIMTKVTCCLCGRNKVIIRRCNLNMCRQCFREKAREFGFKKV